jgi:hypothetical protein
MRTPVITSLIWANPVCSESIWIEHRVIRWVCEKIAQNVTEPIFTVEEIIPEIRVTLIIKKTAHRKQ